MTTDQMTDTRLVAAVAWGFVLLSVLLSVAAGLFAGSMFLQQHLDGAPTFGWPAFLWVAGLGLGLTLVYAVECLRRER